MNITLLYPLRTSLVCLSIFAITCLTQAQIIFVDSTAMGSNDGTSWLNAYVKLQDALTTSTAGDTIKVARGTYFPDEGIGMVNDDREASFCISSGTVVLGGYDRGGSDARQPSVNSCVLTGAIDMSPDSAGNSYHVVKMENVDSTTVLDGFTISNGHADGPGEFRNGGGLYHRSTSTNHPSAPLVRQCIFLENRSRTRGGAVYTAGDGTGTQALVRFSECQFLSNVCDSFDAGGIFNAGLAGICRTSVDACNFFNNRAQAAGALHNFAIGDGEASFSITSSTFTDNKASTNGGALHSLIFDGFSNNRVKHCQFDDNEAGDGGGAIYLASATGSYQQEISIDSCQFTSNIAIGGEGGAMDLVAIEGSIESVVGNSDFQRNKAIIGGAVCGLADLPMALNDHTFLNCTFKENISDDLGGAMAIFSIDGTVNSKVIQSLFVRDSSALTFSGAIDVYADGSGGLNSLILNSTFFENFADDIGGAIAIDSIGTGPFEVNIENSIFWQNRDASGFRGIESASAGVHIAHSLVEVDDCASMGTISCGPGVIFNRDPKFDDAAACDFSLKAGSPLIDQGRNDSLNSNGITLDFAGGPRFVNTIADIGILESSVMPSFCDDTISLLDVNIPNALYQAALKVLSNGTVAGASVTEFKAGNCIDLWAGFEVQVGSVLEASIDNCVAQASSPPTNVTREQTLEQNNAVIEKRQERRQKFRRWLAESRKSNHSYLESKTW